MIKEATLAAEHIFASGDAVLEYDKQIKNTLGNKVFLSRILKATMEEFANTSIDQVEQSIEGEISISAVKVNPGLTNQLSANQRITGNVNENSVLHEGTIYFDIHTYVRLPYNKLAKIIVNVEAQKDSSPGYDLETRALFYCARLLSSQLGTEFTNHTEDPQKYANIKKVYSIWIVMNPSQYKSDSIVHYHIAQDTLYKNPNVPRRNIQHIPYYDILSAVMVFLPYKDSNINSTNELIGMLTTLLSNMDEQEKLKRLENNYHIPLTTDIRKVVNQMCNLGEGLVEITAQKVAESVTESVTLTLIKNAMESFSISAEQAMAGLKIPKNDYSKYKTLISQSV